MTRVAVTIEWNETVSETGQQGGMPPVTWVRMKARPPLSLLDCNEEDGGVFSRHLDE